MVIPCAGLSVGEMVTVLHHHVWMDKPIRHYLDPLCCGQVVCDVDPVVVKVAAAYFIEAIIRDCAYMGVNIVLVLLQLRAHVAHAFCGVCGCRRVYGLQDLALCLC